MENPQDLAAKFWNHLSSSPFVILRRDGAPHSAAPMTAQLDPKAHGAIWFFTNRSGDFAPLGDASFTFSAKGHDLFASVQGLLVEETSRERLDHFWSRPIEAWFPEGKDSPDLLLMRMELGQARVWDSHLGLLGTIKMLLGVDVRPEVAGHAANVKL
ncbi:pyridoxamine 5'-phosphate oxidase family protein [Novosphingobium sp. KACC 22771]|uniref:pyridoxamine 5'-phosphate oxidase family protein n=1 Tax=Novosphingobium sp. KACC 22771 TaxID=3025670 RepID=UPI00236560D1|nr:pyridoxamine 5'-phosphate oxidase family protein [Novosphingobium sp. KACC 22771]WDF72083.1 pyridoxamine 5'-phosphate oxidase family protein [Novosphingobium sp. KACC 22771]